MKLGKTLSKHSNELQAKKRKREEQVHCQAVRSQLLRLRNAMKRGKKLFSLPLQKRKQLAPDTHAAWRPKSPARVGFPFGASRHNVKEKWGILMKNQCPETSFELCRCTVTEANPQSPCKRFVCTSLWQYLHYFRCLSVLFKAVCVLQLTASRLFKGTFAQSWGTFSTYVGKKEEAGIRKQFGVVRSGRHSKSVCTAAFGKLFSEHRLVNLFTLTQTQFHTRKPM